MDRFLRHEAANPALKFRILDLLAKLLHAVDEELLSEREENGHRVEERRFERVVAVPVGCQHFLDIELPVPRHNFDILRRAGEGRVVHLDPAFPRETLRQRSMTP